MGFEPPPEGSYKQIGTRSSGSRKYSGGNFPRRRVEITRVAILFETHPYDQVQFGVATNTLK